MSTCGGRQTQRFDAEADAPMVDPFSRSCHLRPFEGVAITDGVEQAVSTLGLEKARHRVEGFDAALTAALWHESYLDEHQSAARV